MDFTGKRVFVVEDNALNMEIACMLLDTFGIEVKEVYNGKEAVEDVRTTPPVSYTHLLILIECFERIEKYIFRRKNQKECFGEGNFQVLRCSSRYYMLPIAVTALDMMFVLSFLHERNKDAQVIDVYKRQGLRRARITVLET